MEVSDSNQITLAWDPPLKNADSVSSYELWYRTSSSLEFNYLKTIPASDSPTVTLQRDSLPGSDSVFYFRVRAVMASGLKSTYHYTNDENAYPSGGWFLLWN